MNTTPFPSGGLRELKELRELKKTRKFPQFL